MTVFPTRRLLVAVGAWTAAALVVVIVPVLWPVLAAAGVLLGALACWDAWLLSRLPPVHLRRTLPVRAFVGRRANVSVVVEHAGDAASVTVLEDVPAELVDHEPELAPVPVGAGRAGTVTYSVCPTRRGDVVFGPTAPAPCR